jgi:hypothetical protein
VLRQVDLMRDLESRGAELASKITQLEALRQVGDAEDRERAAPTGFDGYLEISVRSLDSQVESLLVQRAE